MVQQLLKRKKERKKKQWLFGDSENNIVAVGGQQQNHIFRSALCAITAATDQGPQCGASVKSIKISAVSFHCVKK